MHCKDCKFWKAPVILTENPHGHCDSPKFQDANNMADELPDTLCYWDYEGNSCGFSTGPEFGCIHFIKKA